MEELIGEMLKQWLNMDWPSTDGSVPSSPVNGSEGNQDDSIDKAQKVYVIFGYCVKTLQIVVYLFLITYISAQSCLFDKKISRLSLTIAVLCLLEAVFAITRIHAMFPTDDEKEIRANYVRTAYFIESVCFFCTIWIFSLKQYETAVDLELIIKSEDLDTTTSSIRKRKKFILP